MCVVLAAAAAFAMPAFATRTVEPSPLTRYVRARAADVAGFPQLAADQYASALSADGAGTVIAGRAYRQGIIAGNRALALRSARLLDASDGLPPDGRLLLLSDDIANRDWIAARKTLDRIEKEQAFAFTVPVVRALIAISARDDDPLALLAAREGKGAGALYAAEFRPLVLAAMGRKAEAVSAMKSAAGSSSRGLRHRLVLARFFAATGDRPLALELMQGHEQELADFASSLSAGKRITAPPMDAAFVLSELLLRVATDLNRERSSALSAILAQVAAFAAPANSDAWLTAAELFSMNERPDVALAILDQIPVDELNASAVRSARVRILLGQERKEEALGIMEGAGAAESRTAADWTMLGDIYSSLDRHADAAVAYGKAIDMLGPQAPSTERLGSLWLLKGSALEQAGDWPAAKQALEQAAKLAPDQAVVLNYLGYSQLTRRENVAEAKRLIERAVELKPGDAAITDSLGWALYLQGDYEAAIAKLETAAESEPGGSEINEHLGDAYWSAGRRIEARYAWQAALVNADAKSIERLSRKIDVGLDTDIAVP